MRVLHGLYWSLNDVLHLGLGASGVKLWAVVFYPFRVQGSGAWGLGFVRVGASVFRV